LNIDHAPTRQDVEAYVQAHFATPDGGYRIPVDQDFLQVRARATGCNTYYRGTMTWTPTTSKQASVYCEQ
jgi:hypothetical protein